MQFSTLCDQFEKEQDLASAPLVSKINSIRERICSIDAELSLRLDQLDAQITKQFQPCKAKDIYAQGLAEFMMEAIRTKIGDQYLFQLFAEQNEFYDFLKIVKE